MTLSPIAIFAYNRPNHTLATLQALMNNPEASDSEITIYCDGAKNTNDQIQVEEVRKICRSATGFKKITVVEHDHNIGLADNIIGGISKILEHSPKVICLEDDLITSPGFLRYMNQALDYYERKNIFSISGYSPPITIPSDYPYSTYAVMRNSSWGWATWREQWQMTDWSVASFRSFMASKEQRKAFEAAGNDTVMMLLKQQQRKIHSWSIRFNYAAFLASQPTIYPTTSLIENHGIDGSGTNMRRSSRYSTIMADEIESSKFVVNNQINTQIALRFKRFYNTSLFRRTINILKIKYYLLTK